MGRQRLKVGRVATVLLFVGNGAIDPRVSTPRRLVRREGTWGLEVERLVALDRGVLRPEIEVVVGEEVILSHLETARTRGLATAASHLMRTSGQNTEDRAFEPVGGAWSPVKGRAQELAGGGPRRQDLSQVESNLASMKRKIAVIEARPDDSAIRFGMVKQLAALAEAHTNTVKALKELMSRVKALEPSEPPPPEAPAVEQRQALRLPAVAELGALARTLLGGKIEFGETTDPLVVGADLSGLHGSTLVDDKGVIVGLILGDTRTTILLGGALMGLAQERVEVELATLAPSDDVIACMSEIFATLTRGINALPGNIHVRSNFLESCAPGAHSWASSARARVDLEDSLGGRIAIVAL